MKPQSIILALALTLLAALIPPHAAGPVRAQGDASLLFIENVGQFPTDEQTRFSYGSQTLFGLHPETEFPGQVRSQTEFGNEG